MMQKISEEVISGIKAEDIPEIAQIEKKCFSEPWSEQLIRGSYLRKDHYFIVAKKNNKILGYAGMYFAFSEAYMLNIAVKSEFRGLGIGYQLLGNLFSFCNKNNLEFLSLEVRSSNDGAIRLYKNMGFSQVGRRKNFYKKPNEDALIMTKYFN